MRPKGRPCSPDPPCGATLALQAPRVHELGLVRAFGWTDGSVKHPGVGLPCGCTDGSVKHPGVSLPCGCTDYLVKHPGVPADARTAS
jgi:hypothetical protein